MHQTSIEYLDSTKSLVEREIRQMLEGCRTNLVQSGLSHRSWPLTMQHFAFAHQGLLSLGNETTPCGLRIGSVRLSTDRWFPSGARLYFGTTLRASTTALGRLRRLRVKEFPRIPCATRTQVERRVLGV